MNCTERVRHYFEARPGRWVSAVVLMRIGGMLSWRTRVAEVRALLGTIENRQRTVKGQRRSEYRWVP